MGRREFDYVLVGGGLQNAFLVLALRARQPKARLALVEQEAHLGGNHTWCFHAGDVDAACRDWMEPLVVHRWSGYDVWFPGFERRIDKEYAAIRSDRLQEVVSAALASSPHSRLLLNAAATSLEPNRVTLEDGSVLQATAVIDARGADRTAAPAGTGYQKFLGLEVEMTRPHGFSLPVLMDATVEQADGFRFVYILPFTETRLLAEDTYFSHDPALAEDAVRQRIRGYLRERGLEVAAITREEKGILPMPWREHHDMPRRGPLQAGYRGGFFHPGTGYSLPVAARLATQVASRGPEQLFDWRLTDFVRAHRRQTWFCHLLNHMLFRWFPPQQRWHVFRRFYGLPLSTIERFYALRLRGIDRARLVVGRPPRGMSLRYRLAKGASR